MVRVCCVDHGGEQKIAGLVVMLLALVVKGLTVSGLCMH